MRSDWAGARRGDLYDRRGNASSRSGMPQTRPRCGAIPSASISTRPARNAGRDGPDGVVKSAVVLCFALNPEQWHDIRNLIVYLAERGRHQIPVRDETHATGLPRRGVHHTSSRAHAWSRQRLRIPGRARYARHPNSNTSGAVVVVRVRYRSGASDRRTGYRRNAVFALTCR